ncbi:3-oxoacyl-acyl-carrier-protein reductase-like protein [Leptotrombidium deliense]|uniref:3-oxoacyl-acyl-carrier-protein reductase-like protein n=1 Tax=Leptotrombidium deliense TaxID=299467 RepID=A0A443S5N9_9ACAR|nr:3-oxoacyl-acyl-carrier-protein reductase-like protein [Leptotrombidium deliense]
MEFEGKVVLVTGSTSGIGEEIVSVFAANGAKVVVTGRDQTRLNNVLQKCEKLAQGKQKPFGFIADITKDEECNKLIDATIKHFGKLDILVNNAGVSQFAAVGDPSLLKAFDDTLAVNVRPTIHLSNLAVPYLTETKGCIVNITSFKAQKPSIMMLPLCATDAAKEMITKSMALELGPKGVRVNCVRAGFIKTPAYENSGYSFEDVMKSVKQSLDKYGAPEDVAHCVLFLCSEKSAFITGTCLQADGGVSDN